MMTPLLVTLAEDINSICFQEYDNSQESLPGYPFSFNPDLYQSEGLIRGQRTLNNSDEFTGNIMITLPKNIFQTVPSKASLVNFISTAQSMPDWNYFYFTPSQQRDFIAKYFPERLSLYKSYKQEEAKSHLFIYLWLYMNGGVYIAPDYELIKSLEPILSNTSKADLYFMQDHERYISPKFLASQPFCEFWLEVVDQMEARRNDNYDSDQEEINYNSGRNLLTDVINVTSHKYEIISRLALDPYGPCETEYNQDSYFKPIRPKDFLSYVKCQTSTHTQLIYIIGTIIFFIVIMVLIALITK